MKRKRVPKRPFMLVEILVALLVLGALASAIAKTIHSGLEESRYRRSWSAAVALCCALEEYLFESGEQADQVRANWRQIARSRAQFSPKETLKDAWGFDLECFALTAGEEIVRYQLAQQDWPLSEHFTIVSRGMHRYLKKHPRRVRARQSFTTPTNVDERGG